MIARGFGELVGPPPHREVIRTTETDKAIAVTRVSNFINAACLPEFEFSTCSGLRHENKPGNTTPNTRLWTQSQSGTSAKVTLLHLVEPDASDL